MSVPYRSWPGGFAGIGAPIGRRGELPVNASGLSDTGLTRLHDRMAWHVETGQMPGLITLVARHGEPHVDVIGARTFGDHTPMSRDAIFRIASLSKPITAAAAMILVDDGVLNLDGAVGAYLPELSDRRVLRSLDASLDDQVDV